MATRKTTTRKKQTGTEITKKAKLLCETMLKDLEQANRPVLHAVKCSLDNAFYDSKHSFFYGFVIRSEAITYKS